MPAVTCHGMMGLRVRGSSSVIGLDREIVLGLATVPVSLKIRLPVRRAWRIEAFGFFQRAQMKRQILGRTAAVVGWCRLLAPLDRPRGSTPTTSLPTSPPEPSLNEEADFSYESLPSLEPLLLPVLPALRGFGPSSPSRPGSIRRFLSLFALPIRCGRLTPMCASFNVWYFSCRSSQVEDSRNCGLLGCRQSPSSRTGPFRYSGPV